MSQFGYIDIENDELEKYHCDVQSKKKICKILPIGRFALKRDGTVCYDSLVCSNKMGGDQTGVSAKWCTNCKIKKPTKKNINRETYKYKASDKEYQDHFIIAIEDYQPNWDIQIEDKAWLSVPKIKNHIPKVGDSIRFYGKGEGYTVRGVDIDNVTYYYRTPEQQKTFKY